MAKKKTAKKVAKRKSSKKKAVRKKSSKKKAAKKRVVKKRSTKKTDDISKRTVLIILAIFVAISIIGTIALMDMEPTENVEYDSASVLGKVSIVIENIKDKVSTPSGESKVRLTIN